MCIKVSLTSQCLLLLIAVEGLAESGLSDLIRAQRESVGLIYSLSATFTMKRELFNDKNLVVPEVIREFRWAFDLGTMRDRQAGHFPNMPQVDELGFALNRYDIYMDRDSGKGLVNWDWSSSRPLVPAFQGPVRAHFGRREQLLRGQALYPRCILLFDVQADNFDVPRSLEFLLSNPEYLDRGPEQSGGLIKVAANHPGFKNAPEYKDYREEYFFEPGNGHLLRKLRILVPGSDGKIGFVFETEVQHFVTFADAVYVPDEIVTTFADASTKKKTFVDRTTLSDIKINGQVDENEFNFRFPENCLVTNVEIPKNGPQDRYELFLWGADNRPLHKLSSATELPLYSGTGSTPQSGSRLRVLSILAVIAIIVASAVIAKKWLGGPRE